MPVVTFARADLCRLIGQDVPMPRLAERMPMLGGDLDRVEGDTITIEWFPDRPDLLTPEGTGRALRAFLGVRPGMPDYKVDPPKTELRVDASVATVRPYAALCFVRGVPFDDALVQSAVDAQEKLTLTMGRRRRKVAIGIHDARGLAGPFTYTCVGPEDAPFVPLGMSERMTPAEVCERHPKGREYAPLLPAAPRRFPVFLDGDGEVISMPPVINAQRTALTARTRDVLIDVTGTDRNSVRHTAALLATGLAERGGTIEAVRVHDAAGAWTCPDLRPVERVIHTDDIGRLLGIQLDADAAAACLQRTGHHAEGFGNRVLVRSPAWRFDLLHDVDWMEDVAIGHGFENFTGRLPRHVTLAGRRPAQALEDRARTSLLGLGFSEVRTLTLSNDEDQVGAWARAGSAVDGRVPSGRADAVRLANPVVEEQAVLRTHLVPSLLRVLSANRHHGLPQRIFECGEVVVRDGDAWRNRLHVAAVELAARTGFSEAKGLAQALLADVGLHASVRASSIAGLVAGRQATFEDKGREVGRFGELHPDVLLHFGMPAACTIVEMDLGPPAAARTTAAAPTSTKAPAKPSAKAR